jgi:methionine-rich copper-binding protein CopC
MKRSLLAVFGVGAWIVVAASAVAHAFLDHAAPAVGSTIRVAPAAVRLWFTQEVEPAFSAIRVEDAKGNVVAAADRTIDATDHTLLRLALPPLPAGRYRVVWRVLSLDSHVSEGDFRFEVAP